LQVANVKTNHYDAFLLLSFGGPEGMADVIPFLENVLRGKNVPKERMMAVAHHYEQFGGVSPINEHNRKLIAALKPVIEESGPGLPIYWGNRNWHPMLEDTLRQMAEDGVQRALAFVTSAYSSYSSCRQYLEDIEKARVHVGDRAPVIDKIRVFHNHPGFVETNADRLQEALSAFPPQDRSQVEIAFTAHSIPISMHSGCDYQEQLRETSRLVSEAVGHPTNWSVAYQSRSGPASQPWLEPDICDHVRALHDKGVRELVIAPIGFVCDHMEVIYDLDTEARALCDELGIKMVRAKTAGSHPRFVQMVRELVDERVTGTGQAVALGAFGPNPGVCPPNCCQMGQSAQVTRVAVKAETR
jgi:protoporphyrin/coproporphyrin ferrochelatase